MAGWGLGKLGMDPERLKRVPKGALEKQALAWWFHRQTTAKRRWIAEELNMGCESRVSQAVKTAEASRGRKVVELKQNLQGNEA
jgi:hypothetical protein